MGAVLPYLRELNFCSMCFRVALATLVGGFLGLDREMHGRPAGFRTYMLVSMAAACTTMLSQYLDLMLHTAWYASGRRSSPASASSAPAPFWSRSAGRSRA